MLRNIGFINHKKSIQSQGIIEKKIKENNSIPLEEILSEESVIDELHMGNKILIQYLNKERVKQMIDYIIKEPPDDTNYEKGHKFPWICSQLFNIENSAILKYFYKTNKELDLESNKVDNICNDKNKENKIELLDYLLTFLVSNKEPNYVLCGYFASLIKTLLNSQSTKIIKYFYNENKDFIKKLINYSYRESISEILNKILQYDITVDEFNIEEMDLIRMEILEDLFSKIDIDMDNEKLDSIATLIKNLSTEENLFTDLLNNRKIIYNLITKPLKNINLLIQDKSKESIINNKRRNFIIIIDIIINWIKSINSLEIDLPSTTDESEDENINEDNISNDNNDNFNFSHTLLSYELFNVLSDLIKKNFNKKDNSTIKESKILQCFDGKEIIPLGLFRIKIVELLGHLFSYFKNIPALYDKLLIDSQFFENAINYLFDYEFNNIYQEALLFLFKKYLNYSEFHPILSEFLFNKLNIMDIIISKLKSTELLDEKNKKDCFIYSSGNTLNRGYISFLVSLAYKINTIIGGDALRINDTLSREGSISFINRAAPFIGKDEITKFYGMEENELYENVSNESEENKKDSKVNCAIKSMEKYLNDKWNEFFNEHISDKIKLYESKLYKSENRDSLFRNPFILENDDEKVENVGNNFGLGDDEDQDILKARNKKPDLNNVLYGDEDIDFNMGNRFKMSMRLPRNSGNNINNNMIIGKKRGSWGSKSKHNKVVVDEVDDIVNDNDNKKEKEEENPLDKLNKNNEKEDDNDEDPFSNFKKKDDDNRKISLISFRKKNKEENINDNNDNNNEENPLDKFKKENTEEKMNIENDDLYDDNEDEDPFNKFNENNKKENNKENKLDNNQNENDKLDIDNLYEEDEENNDDKKDNEDINPLDKFKQENKNKEENKENNKEEANNKNEKEKKIIKTNLIENPFDRIKKEDNKQKKDKKEEEEEEEEDDDEEEENPIDKFKKENQNKEENPIDKLKKEEKEKDKKDNLDDLLYETREEDDDDDNEEEEEEEDSDDNNHKSNKK